MNGIIFDLDGVIVDTAKYHYLGWKRLADEIGVHFDEKKNEKLKGVSRRDSLVALLGHTPDEETINKWCALKNSYYLEYIEKISAEDILPGTIELLQEINSNDQWVQAVASSSKNARLVLEKLKLTDYFQAVVDGTEVHKTKPDPELFIKAGERLHTDPATTIVVEDAQSGIEAALKAGMIPIGIGELNNLLGAHLVVKDLSFTTLSKIEELLKISIKS